MAFTLTASLTNRSAHDECEDLDPLEDEPEAKRPRLAPPPLTHRGGILFHRGRVVLDADWQKKQLEYELARLPDLDRIVELTREDRLAQSQGNVPAVTEPIDNLSGSLSPRTQLALVPDWKLKLCPLFKAGACKDTAATCKRAHGPEELQFWADVRKELEGGSSADAQQLLLETRVRFWQLLQREGPFTYVRFGDLLRDYKKKHKNDAPNPQALGFESYGAMLDDHEMCVFQWRHSSKDHQHHISIRPKAVCRYFQLRRGCQRPKCQHVHVCKNCLSPNHNAMRCPEEDFHRSGDFAAAQ
eukprot:comp12392_c0_seq1/m.7287 comp12392_c0_seq1/g.7287  ORF comp12392_c0_seq1/g.7287 comp12392_c0_seq1/m.7287 type:complete len:300 (-) comp12392_c0_seq1:104-1003(-)